MQLEDYFEVEKFDWGDRIRIKGHRIAIDIVLDEFKAGKRPEEIRETYPTLSLEEVYATITYYLHNPQVVEDYLARRRLLEEANYREYLQQEPSPVAKRIRALKAQMHQPDDATKP